MENAENKISCPKCGESISIDSVLTHQIETRMQEQFDEERRKNEAQLKQEREEVEGQRQQLAEVERTVKERIERGVSEKLQIEKEELRKTAKEEAAKESAGEKKLLEEELAEKDAKLRKANEQELALRKEKNQLEEERQNFELEKQRQLDDERKKIFEEASQKATEDQQHIIAQLKKQLTDATKAKDDLARKLEQGSQQTQGEVLELELEELLKLEFPLDQILPVPKGVTGADIVQKVSNRAGNHCGQIVWELKKTKAWNEKWVEKLKEDQRAIKADLAVIVSDNLPEGVKGFGFHSGIWVCEMKFAPALATALRINLDSLACERSMSVGKNEKMEILYAYLTGVEFKQRVESIVEAFSAMDQGLKKERIAYEKIWSEREKQIKKVLTNTVGMYGDLNGLVTLPQIKTLELEEGDKE